MGFDVRAALARALEHESSESEAHHAAKPAKLAKREAEDSPVSQNSRNSQFAGGKIEKLGGGRNPPTSEALHPHQQPPPDKGPVPHKVGVGGRPVTWTGKVISLDEWRRLSDWERHGPNGRMWNGQTQQWEQAE